MKHVPDKPAEADRPKDLDEMRSRLQRRVSDLRAGWRRCGKPLCRRHKRCCGEGVKLQCVHDGRPRRTSSPEEKAKAISDLYKALQQRRAELAAGARPPEENESRKGREAKPRRGRAARAGRDFVE
jgi:hypothetical protein